MDCIILGASGLIGQQFVRLVSNHPQLKLIAIYSSTKSAGKLLADVWTLPNYSCPDNVKLMKLQALQDLSYHNVIVFSALPSSIAKEIEMSMAKDGNYVFSNASSYRMHPLVPILIPEINADQMNLIHTQREKFGFSGSIVTNSNCSVSGIALVLHELAKILKFKQVFISTYQAKSGGGNKALSEEKFVDNVYPYISNEEEKLIVEGKKILSQYMNEHLIPPEYVLIPHAARVNVVDGHLASVSIPIEEEFELDEVKKFLQKIESPLNSLGLPTAPRKHIIYVEEEDAPQPRKHLRLNDNPQQEGMSAVVGRLRKQNNVLKLFVLVHNTIRGGSGGSVLNAEYFLAKGYHK